LSFGDGHKRLADIGIWVVLRVALSSFFDSSLNASADCGLRPSEAVIVLWHLEDLWPNRLKI